MTAPTIGHLRDLRLQQGLSLREVGERMGVNGSTVGSWERGKYRITDGQRGAYAETLGWEPKTAARPPTTINRGASAPAVDWQERAYCRGADRETFFPADSDTAGQERAKAFCRACAVVDECLEWALTWGNEQMGIAGGKTHAERRSYRRQMNRHAVQAEAS